MVKHIVLWKLKDEANGKDKIHNGNAIKEKLEALVGVVPGLWKAEVNFNLLTEEYDLCLYSEFTSTQALQGYQTHPAHLQVKTFVHQVIEGRTAFDFLSQ